MKKTYALCLFTILILGGCIKTTVINKNYNFNNLKTIAILNIKSPTYIKGVEDLTYKYLLLNNFNVIDNNQITKILNDNNINYNTYSDLQAIKEQLINLNVNAILIGEITYYKPSKKLISTVEHENISIDPGIQMSYRVQQGNERIKNKIVMPTNITKETRTTPIIYNTDAEVGMIIKLLDTNTLNIIWVGTVSKNGSDAMEATENAIKYLLKKLTKDIKSLKQ